GAPRWASATAPSATAEAHRAPRGRSRSAAMAAAVDDADGGDVGYGGDGSSRRRAAESAGPSASRTPPPHASTAASNEDALTPVRATSSATPPHPLLSRIENALNDGLDSPSHDTPSPPARQPQAFSASAGAAQRAASSSDGGRDAGFAATVPSTRYAAAGGRTGRCGSSFRSRSCGGDGGGGGIGGGNDDDDAGDDSGELFGASEGPPLRISAEEV
ncbi:unnamed protein product, partial [Phaeothamnion confervicola]